MHLIVQLYDVAVWKTVYSVAACEEKECANSSTFSYLTKNEQLSDSSDFEVEL